MAADTERLLRCGRHSPLTRPGRRRGSPQPAGDGAARALLADVAATFDRIFTALEPLATEYCGLVEARGAALVRDDLAALRPHIFALLADQGALVAGAGLITEAEERSPTAATGSSGGGPGPAAHRRPCG